VKHPRPEKVGFSAIFRGVGDSRTDDRLLYRLVGRRLARLGFRLVRLGNAMRVGTLDEGCGHSDHRYGVGHQNVAGKRRVDGEWEWCSE